MDVLPGGEQARTPSAYTEWVDDHLIQGPVSRFVLMSVLPGTIFGALSGLRAASLHVGLISGAVFGLLFGATMSVVVWSRMRPLRALSPAQRRQVTTLVRRGTTTVPPHLAAAVVTYSEIVRHAQGSEETAQRTSRVLVFLAAFMVLDVLMHPTPGVLVSDTATAILLVARRLHRRPNTRDRILANAAAADRAARALLQT